MSAMRQIEQLIADGIIEREDMMRLAGLSATQVEKAINNLRYANRIEVAQYRSWGRWKGRRQAIYRIKTKSPEQIQTPPVNSIFNLGAAYAS